MKLSQTEREAIEGMCLDSRPRNLNAALARIRPKLGTGRQGEVTILALRQSLVAVSKWRHEHPFQTRRELDEREVQLIRAYVKAPSLSGGAQEANTSERQASRIWLQIYKALGVKSRPAALTASYLLGYWD